VIVSSTTALLLFALIALLASYVGLIISGVPELSRRVVPFSGAMLLLVSFAWVLPELAENLGWFSGFSLMLAGFAILWLIDKNLYSVCPSCSHSHDHDSCVTRLHGFAGPLVAATAVHSMVDGWALAAAYTAGSQGIWAGVVIHKIPECIAFGIILRAAVKSRRNAFILAVSVQMATLVGAAVENVVAPHIAPFWMQALLAIAGGTFLYLGFHAIHAEWKRRTSAHQHA
jgi:zinc transporter ZupT